MTYAPCAYMTIYFSVGAALALFNIVKEVKAHSHHADRMDCPDNRYAGDGFGCIYEYSPFGYALMFATYSTLLPIGTVIMIAVSPVLAVGWAIKKFTRAS